MQYLFIPLLLLLTVSSFAQIDAPPFGDLTGDEISYSDCPFDAEAEAVILFDRALSNYDDEYNLVTERHIKLKILKESGIHRGNIVIPFYSHENFETIKQLKAVVHTPEGAAYNPHYLDNRSLFTKQVSKYMSTITFALPNVKRGSIIEYSYISVKKSYGGLRSWVFQSDIPTVISSYLLYVLPNLEFAYTVRKRREYPIVLQPSAQSGSTLFEMRNIPGLRNEAFGLAEKDYLQRVDFQVSGKSDGRGSNESISTTWEEFNKDFLSDKEFGGQLSKKFIGEDMVKAIVNENQTTVDKIQNICSYVKKTFQWDEYYSKYTDKNLKTVLEKKRGNSAELNFVLINLLRAAGLEAYPVLVSKKFHGNIDTTYPFKDQFTTVVSLIRADGKNFIVDASDQQETPLDMVPMDLLNSKGFIIDKKLAGFVAIRSAKQNHVTVAIEGKLDNHGSAAMKGVVAYGDYARFDKAKALRSDGRGYREKFGKPHPMKVDSLFVSGVDDNSMPLTHSFTGTYSLEQSGDYLLLHHSMFSAFHKNPFTTQHRFTKIDFGSRYSYNYSGSFELPEGLSVESLPKSTTEGSSSTFRITRSVEQKGNTISINITLEISAIEFHAEEYMKVKTFFQTVEEILNEPIVLKAR